VTVIAHSAQVADQLTADFQEFDPSNPTWLPITATRMPKTLFPASGRANLSSMGARESSDASDLNPGGDARWL
jgi:hypothetical protein